MVYGLTSQRAIIVAIGETTSIELASLDEIHLQEAGKGYGTILFGPEARFRFNRGEDSSENCIPAFEKIKDARRVFSAIREAQKSARQTA